MEVLASTFSSLTPRLLHLFYWTIAGTCSVALAWTPSPSISLALLGGPQEMSATPLCSGSCCASVDVAGI